MQMVLLKKKISVTQFAVMPHDQKKFQVLVF